MEIRNIPIKKIKPYWRNPRNNEGAVDAVCKSIQEYGFNVPIVLDINFVIIAGHTRYKALLRLDWEYAPCIIMDLDERKAKEYRIADNKTNELSSWDYQNLMPELRELDIESMQTFFVDMDLSAMLNPIQVDFAPVTEEEIREHQENADEFFEEKVKDKISSMVEVTCPDCGHEFFVDRNEINRIKINID